MGYINLTREQEDYINAIYELQDTFGIAKIVHLSNILKYSPGAINDEIRRFEKKGFVERIPYRGFKLSEKGMEVARITVRKHRISEAFLYSVLDVPWEKCHILSSEIEHSVAGDLESYILDKIKNMERCPHGNSFDIDMDVNDLKLLDAQVGRNYTVKRITYEEFNTLLLMKGYGIIPGKSIMIMSKNGESILLRSEKGEFPIEGFYRFAVRLNE